MSKTLCSPLRLQDHVQIQRRRAAEGMYRWFSLSSSIFSLPIDISILYSSVIYPLPPGPVVGIQERKGHACSPPSQTPTDGWRVRSGRRGVSPPPKFDPTKDRYVRFFSSTPLISSSTISSRSIRVSSSSAMEPSTAALLRRRILAEKLSALVALLLGSPSPSGAPGGIGRRALSMYSAG